MLISCRPASFTAISLYRAAVLADGAVGYWRLGDVSGTVAVDEIGAAHNGTYEGSPTLNAASLLVGDVNPSVSFGLNQRVVIPNTPPIALVSDFSVECWVKTTTTTGERLVFGSYSGASNTGHGIGLYLDNVFVAFDGVSSMIVAAPGVFNGQPHHLVATYTGSSPDITGRLYIDGALVGSSSSRSVNATDTVAMGDYAQQAGDYIGVLDECAIYPTVLSLAQIQNHYDIGT